MILKSITFLCLVAIVCGTSLALLLVIAVVAFVAYHRIKNRLEIF